ncbi:CapA family protein [Alteribacter natronophilus]|uniref:CapA family protein n=1 Tax=Alteribacter natronophilus TaxID=2583810 RepID=UPI00110EC3E8|nr:CapA family protein [Alteribacter natronophilus]TMW73379.1 hypothetical protein FGB90_03485 [Alteribacter natronophilus]
MKYALSILLALGVTGLSLYGLYAPDPIAGQSSKKIYHTHSERGFSEIHREIKIKRQATVLGAGERSGSVPEPENHYEYVSPYISAADIAVLGGSSVESAEEREVKTLMDAGFNAVSLSGTPYRTDSIKKTLMSLEKSGITYTGVYSSDKDKNRLRTQEINGITFAFLSFTYGPEEADKEVPAGEYIVSRVEEDSLAERIREASGKSDIVILNLHYLTESGDYPDGTQTSVASMAAEAGADIIFGHRQGTLHPLEWLNTRDGRKVFTAYSLGKMPAEGLVEKHDIGGMASITVKDVAAGPASNLILDDPRFITAYSDADHGSLLPASAMSDMILPGWEQHFKDAEDFAGQWMNDLLSVTE